MTQQEANPVRYAASDLIGVATSLLQRSGLPVDRARTVAEVLVEADLMGHTTHGLHLLSPYLEALEAGSMTRVDDPIILADHGSSIAWDGQYLPGPWLVIQAMVLAQERIRTYPVVTITIRQSHHIACLAAYPKRATDAGLLMLLAASDPGAQLVAPFGGIKPLYSPNPLAAGIPTQGDPIILDISMSTTAMGTVTRARQVGQHLPHPWLLDNYGRASDDPADLFTDPPGSILPLGGVDLGYKGFALGILVEVLAGALAGYGRSEQTHRWGASVFLQLIDPDAFGGRDSFIHETQWLAEAARHNPTPAGSPPVRLPGSRALQLRAEQLANGVILHPVILPALEFWLKKLNVAPLIPITRQVP